MPVLPYMLAFAAGAMFYVVVEELIPEASEGQHSNLSTIGFAVGFVLMNMASTIQRRTNTSPSMSCLISPFTTIMLLSVSLQARFNR